MTEEEKQTEAGFAQVRVTKDIDADSVASLAKKFGSDVDDLRRYFRSGVTKSLAWRRQQLNALIRAIEENTDEIAEAIQNDLEGPRLRGIFDMDAHGESLMALQNLDKWASDEPVPDDHFNGKSVIRREPKGVVLLISPWNFPIGLALRPLASIIASGNCCILKPSEVATHSAVVIQNIVTRYLSRDAFRVIQGAVPETTALLSLKWDHIMYTGNGCVGRIVMSAAAKHLTPTTLELGGKSPVFVDSSAKMGLAAKRIVLAKFALNTGQICVAPDYVLVEKKVRNKFLAALTREITAQFGTKHMNPPESDEDRNTRAFGKIINERHACRLKSLLDGCGGEAVVGNVKDIDTSRCFVPPIVIADPKVDCNLLKQEIFGPILAVVTVDDVDAAITRAHQICEHPLALYIFSQNSKNIETILQRCTSGGACVNSALEHLVNPHLPFGGVGESGMGAYHGKYGFDEFSHKRSILYRTTLLPLTVLPPPVNGSFPSFLYAVALKMNVMGWLPRTVAKMSKPGFYTAVIVFLYWYFARK